MDCNGDKYICIDLAKFDINIYLYRIGIDYMKLGLMD